MSGIVSKLLKDVPVPKMFRVKQLLTREKIPVENIPAVVAEGLSAEKIAAKIKPGMRIAITAGSRGVDNVALITKSIADHLKSLGAEPFVVPAMGSHGGASAEGQRHILEGYGVTEEYVGCPILSSMEVTCVGQTEDGRDVYIDKFAAEADGIIVSCRVKPHTGFRGPYESGIMKMMTIGLGKQYGAEQCHNEGFKNMGENVPRFGKAIIKHAPILCAVAMVENAFDKTMKIAAVDAPDIAEEEPKLLKEAYAAMGKIIVGECDVLIVDEIGKDISGAGMDPNITGTFITPYASGGLKSQRIAILDLTEESCGNAIGIGPATSITRRLFDKMDLNSMYANGITSTVLGNSKIPAIMDTDKEAIQICLRTCTGVDKEKLKVVRIVNTLEIEHILLSEAYLEEMKNYPDLIVESEPAEMVFNEKGELTSGIF